MTKLAGKVALTYASGATQAADVEHRRRGSASCRKKGHQPNARASSSLDPAREPTRDPYSVNLPRPEPPICPSLSPFDRMSDVMHIRVIGHTRQSGKQSAHGR
jgi:hypothetical protein